MLYALPQGEELAPACIGFAEECFVSEKKMLKAGRYWVDVPGALWHGPARLDNTA